MKGLKIVKDAAITGRVTFSKYNYNINTNSIWRHLEPNSPKVLHLKGTD